MIFNKRAIMLKFLVTVILAIIIFAPACVFLSKFFRLSDQARDSFNEFSAILQDIDQEKKGEEFFLLKIDAETAVVYFESQQEQMHVFIRGIGSLSQAGSADVYFKRPDTCTDISKGCLCSFQDSEFKRSAVFDEMKERRAGEESGRARIQGEAIITALRGRCVQDFSMPLVMESCTLGTRHNAQGYFCEQGFILERDLIQKTGLPFYLTAPRRIALNIEQKDNAIHITPQS